MITLIFDLYVAHLQKVNILEQETAAKYEKIVIEVLNSSFKMNVTHDKKMLIGLAIESLRLEFVSSFVSTLSDLELENFFTFLTDFI